MKANTGAEIDYIFDWLNLQTFDIVSLAVSEIFVYWLHRGWRHQHRFLKAWSLTRKPHGELYEQHKDGVTFIKKLFYLSECALPLKTLPLCSIVFGDTLDRRLSTEKEKDKSLGHKITCGSLLAIRWS